MLTNVEWVWTTKRAGHEVVQHASTDGRWPFSGATRAAIIASLNASSRAFASPAEVPLEQRVERGAVHLDEAVGGRWRPARCRCP